MASASNPSSLTLEDLPDDCLLLIIKEAENFKKNAWDRTEKTVMNLSLVNKRIRHLCTTQAVFKFDKLHLRHDEATMTKHLKSLNKMSFVAYKLTALNLSFRNAMDVGFVSQTLAPSLVEALSSMPIITELSIEVCDQESFSTRLRQEFSRSQPTFSSVKTLVLFQVPDVPFLCRACPSLDTFIVRHMSKRWKKTFAALPSMPCLRRVEIDGFENWTVRRLKDITPYVKNVSKLCLKGELYKAQLTSFAPHFQELQHLTSLAITSRQWVNTRHLPRYYSDLMILDIMDDEQDNHVLNQTPEHVAEVFFSACPTLSTIRIMPGFCSLRSDRRRKDDGPTDDGKVYEDIEYWEWYGYPTRSGF